MTRRSMQATRRSILLTFGCICVSMAQGGLEAAPQTQVASPPAQTQTRTPTVLFICPHGAGKSVLASAYFQQLARDRGLNVRVEAAGIEPDDAVAPVVKQHLEANGYQSVVSKPRLVSMEDVQTADVVISLGCDISKLPSPARQLQKWDEVPGPSEDLRGADEAILKRVTALVEEMLAQQRK